MADAGCALPVLPMWMLSSLMSAVAKPVIVPSLILKSWPWNANTVSRRVLESRMPSVAPPVPGNVAALNENPQALRGDNLGTDPALRGNRELRNFLQDFNNRIEPPEEVTDDEGAPVVEVQNNAPPPPLVFEKLEAESAELLDRVRERQAAQGVTRPEEEHTAPPEPRTPETVLTERGQNIDRFI